MLHMATPPRTKQDSTGNGPETLANQCGDLYFVQMGADGPLKVGRSRNVPARVRIMQTGNPVPLKMRGVLRGRGWEERCWHFALSQFHVDGEWFEPSSDLSAAIECAKDDGEWWELLPVPDEEGAGWEPMSDEERRDWWMDYMADRVRAAWLKVSSTDS